MTNSLSGPCSRADFSFSGKRVLITGASRGIGAACARAFDRAGARVAITARSAEALAGLATELTDPVVLPADLTDEATLQRVANECVDAMGGLDVLVNNAAVGLNEPAALITPKRLDRQLELNLRNVILLTSWLGPALIEQRGCVVNMSSVAAFGGGVEQAVYAATKGALNTLTANLGRAWGPHGVRVNAIAPGYTDTDIWRPLNDALGPHGYAEFVRATCESIPLRRWASPGEIASVALFLCSDAASYLTGQTLVVDGGGAPTPSNL